jgi:release factor glutamine methyltransferase
MWTVAKKISNQPRFFHYHDLAIELHPEVYDPAEDSFLLLDSLFIGPRDTLLEIGTGCGLIALASARKGIQVLCTDINPFAVRLVQRNIVRNQQVLKGKIEVRQGDLFSVLEKDERFTTIVFNPPYLPTTTKQKTSKWFDIATDGGRDGLRITRRFLQKVSLHLTTDGSAYFVFSSLSDRPAVECIFEKQKLTGSIIARRFFEDEELDVYHVFPTA